MEAYPLKFEPIAVERDWGGTAFFDRLGKTFKYIDEDGNEKILSPQTRLGESYEIADLGEAGETVVSNGFLAGNTLEEITDTYMEELLGDNPSQYFGIQFPLLARLADIRGSLPVHVHPDDHTAFERYDALGKKELWYIMEAEKGASVYLGFNRTLSAEELFDRCMDGSIKEVMHRIRPEKGDIIEIPAGLAHSAEGGILAAIIEEPSLISFNMYGPECGKEEMITHIGESLDFIMLEACSPAKLVSRKEGIVSDTDEFTAERFSINPGSETTVNLEETDSVQLYFCIEGNAIIKCEPGKNPSECRIARGEAAIIPACADKTVLTAGKTGCTMIAAHLREREEPDSYTDDHERSQN